MCSMHHHSAKVSFMYLYKLLPQLFHFLWILLKRHLRKVFLLNLMSFHDVSVIAETQWTWLKIMKLNIVIDIAWISLSLIVLLTKTMLRSPCLAFVWIRGVFLLLVLDLESSVKIYVTYYRMSQKKVSDVQ